MGKFKGISNSTLRATSRLFAAMNIPIISARMVLAIEAELKQRAVALCDHLITMAHEAYEAEKRILAAAVEHPRVNSKIRGAA